MGSDNGFGCSKSGNKVSYFPNVKGKYKGNSQDQPSIPSFEALKRSPFYAHKVWSEEESSPDMVTNMLQFLSINIYTLLDPILPCIVLLLCYLESLMY